MLPAHNPSTYLLQKQPQPQQYSQVLYLPSPYTIHNIPSISTLTQRLSTNPQQFPDTRNAIDRFGPISLTLGRVYSTRAQPFGSCYQSEVCIKGRVQYTYLSPFSLNMKSVSQNCTQTFFFNRSCLVSPQSFTVGILQVIFRALQLEVSPHATVADYQLLVRA